MSEISIPGVIPGASDPSFSADDVVVDADGITATNVTDALEELAAAIAAIEPAEPLTYPTFVWNQYDAYTMHDVAGGGSYILPLDTSDDAVLTNPAGWTIGAGPALQVPDGMYAINWYWEQEDYGAVYFDNYVTAGSIQGAATAIYPTAPMANPLSGWGTASTALKFVGVANGAPYNAIRFNVNNKDASPRGIVNLVTVTRSDV